MNIFDTKTEESFYNFVIKKGIKCEKIKATKKDESTPDFICEFNGYNVVFELKDLRESGTAKEINGVYSQNITIASSVSRFLSKGNRKFLNSKCKKIPSALLISNLRPYVDAGRHWQEIFISQVENALKDNLNKYREIGNVIIAGYNKSANQMTAFHVYENLYSNRIIKKDFFTNISHRYYDICL